MHCYADHGFNREHAIFEGDRCFVVCPSDLAPVIVAGNAFVHVHGKNGPRTIDAEDLFVPASRNLMRMHALDDGEVLTAVEFRVRQPELPRELPPNGDLGIRGIVTSPIPLEKRFPSVFIKFAMRNAFDFPLANICVFLDRDGNRVHRCRIALGGVAATPYRPLAAERAVAGNMLTDEVIHAAGRAAMQGAKPLEQNAYKVRLVEKLVVQALQELSE
jgi:xanthine dehydrogenase YagS FAD-binding subunit